jgi:deoxyribonuclease-4
MKFGAHLSISKGLEALLSETEKIGADAVQIFARNPRGRGETVVPEEAAATFRGQLEERGWPLVIHAPYYVNVGSGTPNNQRIAREVVKLDLEKGDLLGADAVVVHLGTAGEGNTVDEAVPHTAETINAILDSTEARTRLLLETSAGTKRVGSTFEQLAEILAEVDQPNRLGVCFDTCHVYTAGYDDSSEGMQAVLDTFDRTVGLKHADVIHCNDTLSPLGGGRDAHWHIGLGNLGDEAFRILVNDPRLQEKTFIMETPKEPKGANIENPDVTNLARLRSLIAA